MQPLRRWVPVPARGLSEAAGQPDNGPARGHPDPFPPNALPHDSVAAKDLVFCAEFAARGGQARSPGGFRREAELVRMHRAELLDLERDPVPPYGVIAVSLSAGARNILSGSGPVSPVQQLPQRTANVATMDQTQRRNGFEVARAMAGVAVKAEIAAWITQGSPGGPGALEQRMVARINELPVPFLP